MARRRIQDEDRPAIAEFIRRHWEGPMVVTHDHSYFPHEQDGFVEWRDDRIVGLLTYVKEGDALQILTIDSTLEGQQIGTSLMLMAIDEARKEGVRRVWLTANNDNVRMIGFSQRLGFRLVEVRPGAVDQARKIKPQIPEVGWKGIPIHDEVVLELRVKPCIN